MDLSCINFSLPLPVVPILSNGSNMPVHPSYKANSGSISHMISASMARSTFSINDVESLLTKLFNENFNSWSFSTITATKPIPSIIIYTSIALALFLIFSITFLVLSCHKNRRKQRKIKRSAKSSRVCFYFLIIVYLLGIADMIYVAYRVNMSKISIDNAIKQVNQEIYPKEIAEDIKYFNRQLKNLDGYFSQSNSILINASKSIFVTAFDGILNEQYYIQNIAQHVNSIDKNFQALKVIVNDSETLSPLAVQTFHNIEDEFDKTFLFLKKPLEEICNYTKGSDTDMDREVFDALYIVHRKLSNAINTINNDILGAITPWEDHILIGKELEEEIRGYINLIGIIAIICVIFIGCIPLSFFIIIIISRLCTGNEHKYNPKSQIQMNNMKSRSRFKQEPKYEKSDNGSSRTLFCLIYIAFIIMFIMLIAMVLITGVYYAADLVVQGACRTVHDDQPFLINFTIDKFVGSNDLFVDRSEMNRTVYNIINDCREHVHFTRKLFDQYFSILDDDVENVINKLNEKIHSRFVESIKQIDILSDINLILTFISEADQPNIKPLATGVEEDLIEINRIFNNITSSSSVLPKNLTQSIIKEFENYVKEVLESTIDGCPLPLTTIYETDTLLCHDLASSLNGLWLSIFFFMFIVMVGFCIFGISIYTP